MKTETIWKAELITYNLYFNGYNNSEKRYRQWDKFHTKLMKRIEEGDRAREWLRWLKDEIVDEPDLDLELEVKSILDLYKLGK